MLRGPSPTPAVVSTGVASSAFRLAASCTLGVSKRKDNGEGRVSLGVPERAPCSTIYMVGKEKNRSTTAVRADLRENVRR